MPILGGSPLGLIGVGSYFDTKTGLSTLPYDGQSIGVRKYNQSNYEYTVQGPVEYANTDQANQGGPPAGPAPGAPTTIAKNKSSISIFSRKNRPTRFTPWPGINNSNFIPNNLSPNEPVEPRKDSRLHGDDLYDTSILNILTKLEGTKGQLRSAHFAYLKNLGVFPNNRLMIARRFGGAASGSLNLGYKGGPPLSVLISWVGQNDDFFSIDFGEEWEEAEADFTNLLNDLGNDFMKGSGIGTKLGGGLGAVPLPGFTEFLQRKMLERLGVFSEGASSFIPAGEPNLIKQAKRRKTIGYSQAGSGLKCNFQVKMVCEYEQKFISGLDPTIVWLDIVQNILRFGTSPSTFYGLSAGIMSKIMAFVNNPLGAIQRAIAGLWAALQDFYGKIKSAIVKFFDDQKKKPEEPKSAGPVDEDAEANAALDKEKNSLLRKIEGIFAGLKSGANALLKNIVGKYKVRIQGILAALSGAASGPYHVTIGNPLRPVFSSGDLIVSDVVKLTFGPTLAFNDLPSSIKAEFTLVPARPLGLQEIMARFNGGHLRSVVPYPTLEEKETILRSLGKSVGVNESELSTSSAAFNRNSTSALAGPTEDESRQASATYQNNLDSQLAESYGLDANAGPEAGPQPPETPEVAESGGTIGQSRSGNNPNNNSNINNASNNGTGGTQGAGTNGDITTPPGT